MKTNNYYDIKMLANSNTAEIKIYGDIGGWDGNFLEDIEAQVSADVTQINIKLKSGGGSAFEGFDIYTFLKQHKAKVHIDCVGVVASAATLILMAADSSTITNMAMIMIHDPQVEVIGKESDIRSAADLLKKIKENCIALYGEKLGLSDKKVSEIMSAETWYKAQEAVDAGLVDKVFEGKSDEESPALSLEGYGYKNMPVLLNSSITGELESTIMTIPKTPEAPVIDKAYLEANHAVLLKEIKEAAMAEGYEKGKADECNRIKSVEELTMSGFEDVIMSCKYEHKLTSEQTAIKLIQAQKAQGVQMIASMKADSEQSDKIPNLDESSTVTASDPESRWNADASLRDQYGNNKGAFLAYEKAVSNGQVLMRGVK